MVEADADEAQIEIAGGLGVVTGEDAKTAGGDGQRFMEAKLSAKIGDGIFLQCAGVAAAPCVGALKVFVEVGQHAAHTFAEGRVLQVRAELLLGDFAQDGHGIVVEILPAARRKLLEDFLGALVPSPPEVAGEPVQSGNEFLQFSRGQRLFGHICLRRKIVLRWHQKLSAAASLHVDEMLHGPVGLNQIQLIHHGQMSHEKQERCRVQ